MKSYAIHDEDLERTSAIGYLFYYEKSESFIIELCDDLDEWEAPLLFQKFIREKRYTVSREVSYLWVRERVIPSGRQNIGSILRNHKLKDYSEMALLILSKGRCSQDNCHIEEISETEIPQAIQDRRKKNLWECFPTQDYQLLCLFEDDIVEKVELSRLSEKYKDISYVIKNRKLFESVKIGAGGYSVVFNDSIEVEACDLRTAGVILPLTSRDFYYFICRNVMDTTKACEVLQCTRQNLSYMIKEDRIKPVIYGTKGNLYLKGEVEKIMNG